MPAKSGPLKSPSSVVSSDRRILGCVPELRVRQRLELALRGYAPIQWLHSFSAVRDAVREERRPCTTVLIAMRDANGDSAADFAPKIRENGRGVAIVACCELNAAGSELVAELARAGVHDILFGGFNDDGHSVRMILFGACLGAAGDVVLAALAPSVPPALWRFVDLAARRPRELRRVGEVASAMGVSRQTLGRWCRVHNFIGPEELLMWVRLLLVAALLEVTDETLESIAYELQYGSPTALRNRIREYAGLKATDLRNGGLGLMLDAYHVRIKTVGSQFKEAGKGAGSSSKRRSDDTPSSNGERPSDNKDY